MPYPELICLQTRTDTGTAGACKLRLEEMIDQRSWLAAGWDQPIDVLMQLVSAPNITADQPSSRQLAYCTYESAGTEESDDGVQWELLQCRTSAVAGRSPAAGDRSGDKAAMSL
jgi:hypothetical protein